MFAWLKLHGVEDSEKLIMERALEEKVLMVPGASFMPNLEASPYVRAAFSTATPEEIDTALSRLAKLLA
jgi:kynurenine/2-aminoadipate aminotransferase